MNNNTPSADSKKNTGKRIRFNLIDFLLIVVILLIVAALVYVFLPTSVIKNMTADRSEDIQYSIEIIGVDEEFLDKIAEKDIVLDSVSKNDIGTVTAIDFNPYTQLEYNETEKSGVLSPIAGKYNVIVTISATADVQESDGYNVNGTRIAVGEKIYARFPNYLCEAYCISIPRD